MIFSSCDCIFYNYLFLGGISWLSAGWDRQKLWGSLSGLAKKHPAWSSMFSLFCSQVEDLRGWNHTLKETEIPEFIVCKRITERGSCPLVLVWMRNKPLSPWDSWAVCYSCYLTLYKWGQYGWAETAGGWSRRSLLSEGTTWVRSTLHEEGNQTHHFPQRCNCSLSLFSELEYNRAEAESSWAKSVP